MALKKQKYYVVWHGHRPGIYDSWQKCQEQIKNFPNAIYKSFESKAEAEAAYRSGPQWKARSTSKTEKILKPNTKTRIISESISVDAACSGNPGAMEYRGVWTADKTELFHVGPVPQGTNNIGEFLGIVHALAYLQKHNKPNLPIYTDSKTAMSWVKRKKANTKLPHNHSTAKLFELIGRAEKWLRTNEWNNPILKWETESWGEIPADFGRK